MKRGHEFFMAEALRLSAKAQGATSPNPMVGAVVVKNGQIIASGYHQHAGGPHAEIVALNKAGAKARQASLYVTLEPCTHYGRTPPCIDRVIQSGVKEVIIGIVDPNPVNNGKGIALLREQRIAERSLH
jgi:diaminohydroxyphosphoribosylaminopyrimidine deaminase / 5-amino-6-(5-phosphoribosylamino)uracil reductase